MYTSDVKVEKTDRRCCSCGNTAYAVTLGGKTEVDLCCGCAFVAAYAIDQAMPKLRASGHITNL